MTRCLGLAGAIGILSVLASSALADAPPSPAVANYLGILGVSSQTPLTFNTMSANFDTEMALYSETGQLLANNDDFDFGSGLTPQSQIGPMQLPAGRYYLAICGFNSVFQQDWAVTPGTASGSLAYSFTFTAGSITNWNVPFAPGEVQWFTFDIVHSPPLNIEVLLDLGPIGESGMPIRITPDANGTGTAPALCIFDANGQVVDLHSAATPWLVGPLAAGTYYLAIGADTFFGTPFSCFGWRDGDFPFELTIDDVATGNPQVRLVDNLIDEQYRFYRFEITPPLCTFNCPPNVMGENENPYDQTVGQLDTVNGACTAPGDLTTPAVLGQTWCGTTVGQVRYDFNGWAYLADVDFYEIILPAAMDVDLMLDSTHPAVVRIIDPAALLASQCNLLNVDSIAIAGITGCAGPQGVSNVQLSPGTYLAVVYTAPPNVMPIAPYALEFIGRPSSAVEVGGVAPADTPFTISTAGSNFDTEIALFDANGTLLDFNDDYNDLTSRLDIAGLPTGDYYLMAIGYNTDFFDNFGVDVRAGGSSSTAGGTLLLDIAGNPFVAAVGAGRGFWYHFQVYDPAPCAADLNMDGNLDFFDVQAFLQAFSAQNPIADFVSDGIFNFFDVQAFLQAFSAGCP
ncbi:MAG: hypothetical protein Kow0022_09280 [Phycisphaerales bacterium]